MFCIFIFCTFAVSMKIKFALPREKFYSPTGEEEIEWMGTDGHIKTRKRNKNESMMSLNPQNVVYLQPKTKNIYCIKQSVWYISSLRFLTHGEKVSSPAWWAPPYLFFWRSEHHYGNRLKESGGIHSPWRPTRHMTKLK